MHTKSKKTRYKNYSTIRPVKAIAESGNLTYKICRENANLTQNEAAYCLDIKDVSQLSRYENGHVLPPDRVVLKMASEYGDAQIGARLAGIAPYGGQGADRRGI